LAGGYLVLNQKVRILGVPLAARPMSFGQIMVFYAFLIGCTDPLRKMSDVFGAVQKGAAAADRIMPFIARAQAPADRGKVRIRHARQPILFEHVDFHYVKQTPVLQDVTFRIEPGETLAIIGPNGCGKSTLINLLLRFYDPARGRILLGDLDLQDIRRKNLRRRVALVSQKAVLFNDSVFNNIAYGTRNATREQVVAAARKAHAHEFIMRRLSNGYETNCGDGGKRLSGGQQQRIALARAILRDPDILILDEAASQIDPNSEQLIRESLTHFVKGRTTLMITHRMSTLELADRILVMDSGRVLDVGTHDELLQRCPVYQALRQTPLKRTA
jgi:ATP-binding cassette, subfamily B, bacterial MsbA